jgi:hypothetical protein
VLANQFWDNAYLLVFVAFSFWIPQVRIVVHSSTLDRQIPLLLFAIFV